MKGEKKVSCIFLFFFFGVEGGEKREEAKEREGKDRKEGSWGGKKIFSRVTNVSLGY